MKNINMLGVVELGIYSVLVVLNVLEQNFNAVFGWTCCVIMRLQIMYMED